MTSLWETLPVAVMDAAHSLHNDAFRQLLPRYRGYECHTVRLWARGRVKEVAEAPGSVVFFPRLVLVLLWRRRHPVVVLRGAEHFTITSLSTFKSCDYWRVPEANFLRICVWQGAEICLAEDKEKLQ
ncbi:hypothetical protein VOLCADRAFT_101043 [Volvox carteri f. nagariensis]|uniref:Uncharacterized protein n=1 Tax=Volvox carteri f. nagariensis TaxID=3068 RepID=D8ULL8_VOLCA|nr:uncharacterized protein VOLCADRAFT_101043 [Volvox carteri f. nagariensis]EFJ39381.1 hypothetical protein VOLCADRAFT_101043 [Volvox carteri f. nagariensis]|eukprot:XP_002959554.1 hypothetical protein VOLCADRAFT_101043 [Volvox carteri f. nagariensis]